MRRWNGWGDVGREVPVPTALAAMLARELGVAGRPEDADLVLLNTCVGDSLTVPDFGLMDFSDIVHELPQGIHTIQQSIRNVIMKFEPRLKNVSVRYIPDEEPLILRFEVVARLNDASRSVVRLRTKMSSGGTFQVE